VSTDTVPTVTHATPRFSDEGDVVALLLAERRGEFAVLGLGLSGESVARLLHRAGLTVYASDSSTQAAAAEAALRLSALGIVAETGGHDLARVARASCVVVSPGIPPEIPALRTARDAGIPIVSEVEIGLRLQPGLRYIAVTGTNGKTTTTSLIAHLLRALDKDAVEAGNIGTPVAELAFREVAPEWVALELSSFQLHDTPGVNPAVGVLTNLSPDHLDRYDNSVDAYYADKQRMFVNASNTSRWVIPADDITVANLTRGIAGQFARFSTQHTNADGYLDQERGQLVLFGAPFAARADFPLPGDHNVANLLAALLAVMSADASHATPAARVRLAESLPHIKALPHRIERVADIGHVVWFNDSKATNVSSALVAIAGMTRPTVLLLGGRHKGEPYTALAAPIIRTGRAVIAYGEAAPIIHHDLAPLLDGAVSVHRMDHGTFAEVIAKARDLAMPGDAVLLSPACSSFDMFANYKERGYTFAALARGDA
jgi:UDP-N-acetylmuramoylalanine--D-glutamate ligase